MTPPEAAVDEELADLGELAGPLAHEFNNLLNNLVLHLAVLESDLPPQAAAELSEIRRQTVRVTRLVQQFQQLRRRRTDGGRPVDLGRLVQSAAAALAREAADPARGGPMGLVKLDLPAGLPPVWTAAGDL